MVSEILQAIFILLTAIIIVYLIRHYLFTISVLRKARKNKSVNTGSVVNFQPTVTLLIPARNEERVIGRLLSQISEFTYPKNKLQVLAIDDASSDKTGEISDHYAHSNKQIQVLHRKKEEGGKGKASALNFALKYATGEIVLCFDADYCPKENIVEKLVKPFADPAVGAVQGRPIVLNEPENMVTRLVSLERIGGYRVDQEARSNLNLIPQFGGTVGGFRRSIIETLGGFDEFILAEDTDLTFQIYLLGYKICYVGDAECYEEAVNTWKAYWKQRSRWAKGHMQVCFKHLFNVLKSNKLSAREKTDGTLILGIYFMPVITLLSFFIGAYLIWQVPHSLSEFSGFLFPYRFIAM